MKLIPILITTLVLIHVFIKRRILKKGEIDHKKYQYIRYIDILLFLVLYFGIVYVSYVDKDQGMSIYLVSFTFAAIVLIYTIKQMSLSIKELENATFEEQRYNIIPSVIRTFSIIVITFAILNHSVYFVNNDAFEHVKGKSFISIAFDFLYYSISTSITLGGGSISPMHYTSRLLSIIQIVLFYYFIGNGILNVISSFKNKYKENKASEDQDSN